MSTPLRASIGPLGDQAMLLTLEGDREQCNRAIVRLAAALRAEGQADAPPAIVDVVPALISLAVFYDPRLVPSTAIERRLRDLADRVDHLGDAGNVGRLHVVPVRYDGSDLSEVARTAGLDPGDVARRHAAREYRVRFLGFAPGFAYLGPLDPALVVPRRSEPRRRIPA
ncbi:MAG TPA: carboxyltransferase domain-containing protein, partial [Gemmatimonadales bacterium]|nr:carboxyltransferase domain-containing protein [Gemmatimonadales bacterium]